MTESHRGRVRVETGPKRVRTFLGGSLVADTLRPLLVWEVPYYPAYYIPAADVHAELVGTGTTERSPSRGTAEIFDVVTAGGVAKAAARRFADSPLPELRDAVRFDWDAMSEWFEEDEPVYTHPRDPYKRVDILASGRTVRVELDGVVLAESRNPRMLFETSLPTRYYIPLTDVRMDLLRPSTTVTHCPYKGEAHYWAVEVEGGPGGPQRHEDLVWIYRTPLPESQKIAGLACFYNERVDVFLDGVRQSPSA
ncbi:DUF427 domain-containing protein [Dactylosporangium sp. AC04546]|uniref:DUF427 domain-containing protein n=1 Tax=Dactylosporangium sp. AC04546 TaxID=2862460 RepID=UPI001EE12EEE|nr:DUF427 domain-containing protein [Dactylosporangium sp. AC04546]WVK80233.1 DUF427 domain-containing protein [Dactylosporangium sp. AC04546]